MSKGPAFVSIEASFPLERRALHSISLSVLLFAGSQMLDDATLLSGFVAGDAPRTRELLQRLIPLVQRELNQRWPALKAHHDDIVGEIGVTLVLWRAEARDGARGKLRPEEPLQSLATRLVNSQARKARRAQRTELKLREGLRREPQLLDVGAETATLRASEKAAVRAAIVELPLSLRQAARAGLAHDAGEGPAPHLALQCGRSAAKMRLLRARAALALILLRDRGDRDERPSPA